MMTNNPGLAKKRYQVPSITSPSANFIPAGKTSCSYGDLGAACENGDSPSVKPASCNIGNNPEILNCANGTTANDACMTGTDAILGCDTGVRVPGECISGDTPLAPVCDTGTSVPAA